MSANKKITEALEKFGYPIAQDLYTGKESAFFTFNYADDRGADFGDGEPLCTIVYMQIHLILPFLMNCLKIKNAVREALFKAGFTYPEVTMLIENNIRHIIFECEMEEEREGI